MQPNLQSLVERSRGLGLPDVAALVRMDQQARWLRGEPLLVEAYLGQFPDLSGDVEAMIDLIYSEVVIREETGALPKLQDYVERFPEHREALERQFALHEALKAEATVTVPGPEGTEEEPANTVAWLAAGSSDHRLESDLITAANFPRIDGYEFIGYLGAGAMGRVVKARHKTLDRTFAIKFIRKQQAESRQAIRRFRREIRAIAQLSHPNIVHAYDAGELDDNTLYYVMDFVDGPDLKSVLKARAPLAIDSVCQWMLQVTRGLTHIHECQLVHRDIKPSNIALASDGTVAKILDLGLTLPPGRRQDSQPWDQSLTTLTEKGTTVGTPDYISPEQITNSHEVDIRSDIYSLGCTFYQLLTGKVPFPARAILEKFRLHVEAEPASLRELRDDVPTALSESINKMMAKQPTGRFQTPAELAAALEAGIKSGWHRMPLPKAEPPRQDWGDSSPFASDLEGIKRPPARFTKVTYSIVGLSCLLAALYLMDPLKHRVLLYPLFGLAGVLLAAVLLRRWRAREHRTEKETDTES